MKSYEELLSERDALAAQVYAMRAEIEFSAVKIIEMMGRIGHGNSEASDEMSDILA